MRAAVRAGCGLAVLGAAHAALNVRLLRRPPSPVPPLDTEVSVLLPARDEERQIARCLRALLAQQGRERIEVLVLNDESSDATRDIALTVAREQQLVRVLDGEPPPPGWLGKPHACWQLAQAARATSRVLVFVDADVLLCPNAVAAAVAMLDRDGLDLVSPYPRQLTATVAERLVQPLLQWSWLTFLPLRLAETSPRRSLSAANGQFLAVRRDAYQRAGGHAAVRREVLDDIALIRAVKAAGGTGGIVDGTALATCRMYRGWREVRDGYGKSLASGLGSAPRAAAAVGLLALGYLLPAAAALRGARAGVLGYAAGVAGRLITARATGGRTWPDALAHPLSIIALAVLTGRSVLGARRGTLAWKDRAVR